MREILFRGKRLDNGEWVEGYLYITHNGEHEISIYNDEVNIERWTHEVDPSTIGQYTGLTDKNGNRVVDGDLLPTAQVAAGLGGYYQPPLDYPVNVVVKWDLCAWMWETLCEDKRYISFPDAWCHYECEVIGNITDNPELLENNLHPQIRG